MKQSLEFIDFIIELETKRDAEFKAMAVLAHKSSQATGYSAMLHHLKTLKELVVKEQHEHNEPTIPFTFTSPPIRQGCIGQIHCDKCKKNFSGTCLCLLICPDCKTYGKEGYNNDYSGPN